MRVTDPNAQNGAVNLAPGWLPNTSGGNVYGGQDPYTYSPAIGTPGQAPAPAAPPQDFGSYLKTDPGYAALLQSLQGQQGSLVTQFGDASGIEQIGAPAGTMLGGDIQQAAANNPFSWLAQDRKATGQHVGSINNAANAHGLLYSGANAQGQVNEYGADQQRQYAARSALQNALGGLGAQQAQGVSQAAQNYLLTQPKPAV